MVKPLKKCHPYCVIVSRDVLSKYISGFYVAKIGPISVSSDNQIQELGLQLHVGGEYLQTHDPDYSQLTSIPMARRLYLESKKLAAADDGECLHYDKHLDTLSVQCKLNDSIS